MRVVFMGTPEFAAICLDELLNSKHEVAAVVSVEDKPAGRGKKIRQSAVTRLALKKNIKLLQPVKLRDPKFIEELKAVQADAFVVVAFRMLPKEVWQIPPKGTFNLHASLLPQYRGAAPINWAIINGEKESGVTTFLIDEKIDTGNILLKEKVDILPEDNAGNLHDKLAEIGKSLIIETINGLEDGSIQPQPQETAENLKSAPKIFTEDCYIDWSQSIEKIHNMIRGLSPYPGARTSVLTPDGEKMVKIFDGEIIENQTAEGKLFDVLFDDNYFDVVLKEGIYRIKNLQPEGKRRMKAGDFINGLHDKKAWKVL